MKIYEITAMGKPRMTRADRWKKRDCVMRYWEFKDKVRELGIIVPESGSWIKFYLPMPVSWPKKKREAMLGQPHKIKPDKDNLEKALLDSIYDSDAHIWDSRVSKYWSVKGMITIEDI